MFKQWIGCLPENFRKGRQGHTPKAIVIHNFTSLADAEALFSDPQSAQSIHYLVNSDGAVRQYVEEGDTAFHAGVVINPSWRQLRSAVNPNYYTIGIGAIQTGEQAWPDSVYASLDQLIQEIACRHGFDVDVDHIVLHSEIRASKSCPGAVFDRDAMLDRIQGAPTKVASVIPSSGRIHLVANAHLRDGEPSKRARIAATLLRGQELETVGYTDDGERVQGISAWYQTPDNHFLWAGNTDVPQPVLPAPPPEIPPQTVEPGLISCGIPRIEALLTDPEAVTIGPRETDLEAVGAVQDLLSGQGYKGMPDILSPYYGRFGAKTERTVEEFQSRCQFETTGEVDAATLQALLSQPAIQPRLTRIYLSAVLKIPYQGMEKILAIVALMEGAGKFGALNLNTDRAGLSFGIIQWAQKPGRLREILAAFSQYERSRYVEIFGGGDTWLADALLSHTAKPSGGVNASTGETTDARFDLIKSPWVERFRQAALEIPFQKIQIQVATQVFLASYRKLAVYAPLIQSERGVAFMLDVANQFGDGKKGLAKGLYAIHEEVYQPGMSEMDLLHAVADETVERIVDTFKRGVRARRDSFLFTTLLSEHPATFLP